MKTDYDPIFEAFASIQESLGEKVGWLQEQIRRTQLECLGHTFEEQKDAASECVEGIDQQLIKLSVYIEEYQRLYMNLKELQENKIPQLGGTAPPLPEPLGGGDLAEILIHRIDYLKTQGKI
ncbi:MAG TPA: hypothetical protein VE131_04385 [Terriglobales bacterium]|nr:hypothetical protein [Terriglobales bacterium]